MIYESKAPYIKCGCCSVKMRISALVKEPNVQLCVNKDGERIWLTAFSQIILKLIEYSDTNVALLTSSEEIKDATLSGCTNITFAFNAVDNVI